MTKALLDWMTEPWPPPLPFHETLALLPAAPSRLQVYIALIGLNGGPGVHGWGAISYQGPFGRMGLYQDEALTLMRLDSFVNGWLAAAGDEQDQAFFTAMNAECERLLAAFRAESPRVQ